MRLHEEIIAIMQTGIVCCYSWGVAKRLHSSIKLKQRTSCLLPNSVQRVKGETWLGLRGFDGGGLCLVSGTDMLTGFPLAAEFLTFHPLPFRGFSSEVLSWNCNAAHQTAEPANILIRGFSCSKSVYNVLCKWLSLWHYVDAAQSA